MREYAAKVNMDIVRAEKELRKSRTSLSRLLELCEELSAQLEYEEETGPSRELYWALTTQYILQLAEMVATPADRKGPLAEDILMANLAVLLPSFFESMASDPEELAFQAIPTGTETFITEGRALVSLIREECSTYLTTPDCWAQYLPMFEEFWKDQVFSGLFPSCAEEWRDIEPLSVSTVERWLEAPYDRVVAFPEWNKVMKTMEAKEDQVQDTFNLGSHFAAFA